MRAVLDASAVLAALLREPGREVVAEALASGSIMCTYNLAEVATRYAQRGASELELHGLTSIAGVELIAGDAALAVEAALIFRQLPRSGLSLGDRLCLALARREGLPVLTGDRAWSRHAEDLGVQVALIR